MPANRLPLPLPPMSGGNVISIGAFDGVHAGHQALAARAAETARRTGGAAILYAFDPHPRAILRPGSEPSRLTTFEDRKALLLSAGADEVRRLEPTRALLALEPREFVREIVRADEAVAFVEGPDFRFGRNRSGTLETLEALGREFGFCVIRSDAVERTLMDYSVVRASSTLVRALLGMGRVADVACVLGRAYHISGVVRAGEGRGRAIGIPTANVESPTVLPADGVYAGIGRTADGKVHAAAINIGLRPTFGGGSRECEVHLLGYSGAIGTYGWNLRVEFHAFLREEMRFSGVEAVVGQIRRDLVRAERHVRPVMAERRCA